MHRKPLAICQALPRRSTFRRIRLFSTKPDAPAPSTDIPKPRLDYRAIADNVVYKSHNAFNRKSPLPVGAVQSVERLYKEHKDLSGTLNAKRNTRSVVGERIRIASSSKDEEGKRIALEEAKVLKNEVSALETRLSEMEDRLLNLALAIPNDTHPLSPLGPESSAVVLSTHGPSTLPASPARDHVSVGRALGWFDFEAGATTTGSSWFYLRGDAALLELALTHYAMSIAIKHGFTPVTTPDVVRSDVAYRCGFQPRDPQGDTQVSQMYHLAHTDLVLSGTAEIPLAGSFANKILSPKDLPAKLIGVGRAFRAEAGARGADTRGLYRVHQFTKLELFVVCSDEDNASEDMMEELRRIQVDLYEGLGFPFRVLDMPTEELGASAYRKYDMEAWMPGRGSWGEISSTSNCTDYQARRLHIRHRRSPSTTPTASPYFSAGLPFAHTLNGTAAAIPRLIVALLENGARFNESGEVVGVDLPEVLRPFWLGDPKSTTVRWV